jgi:hypothetical protein
MSGSVVYPNEMNAPHGFDDDATEALLAGRGHEYDSRLAEVLAALRVAFIDRAPAVGAPLSALLAQTAPTLSAVTTKRSRFERLRSSMLAKIGAATTAAVAATGGLAVAHALPAPLQETMAHLGIGAPAKGNEVSAMVNKSTTTTVAAPITAPTIDSAARHGRSKSAAAHERPDSCNRALDVSDLASGGRSRNDAQQVPPHGIQRASCETTTTTASSATPGHSPLTKNTARNNQGVSEGVLPTNDHRHDG